MKEPRHDDERLAALLEGRLEGPERDELLAYLAAADEDFYVFAKTAAVLREMEEEEQAAQAGERTVQVPVRKTSPPSTRSRWGTPRRVVMLTAFVGLVASTIFPLARARLATAESPLQVAARLNTAGLPADRAGQRFDAAVRGSDDVSSPADAARAGVLLTDLAVAIGARDTAATQRLAERIKRDHDRQGGRALDSIAARAGGPPTTLLPLLQEATVRLEDRMGRDALRLGAWTEAAVLAGRARHAEFFDDGATGRMLGRASKVDAAAAARVRTALHEDGPPDWPALDAALVALLRAVTAPPPGGAG